MQAISYPVTDSVVIQPAAYECLKLSLRELYANRSTARGKELFQDRVDTELTTKEGAGKVIKLALMELDSDLFNYAYDRLYKLSFGYNHRVLLDDEIKSCSNDVLVELVTKFLKAEDNDFAVAFFKAEGEIDHPQFNDFSESWEKLGQFAASSVEVARLVTSRKVVKAMKFRTTWVIHDMFHWQSTNREILELALQALWTIYELHGELLEAPGYYLPWENMDLGVPESQKLRDIELLTLIGHKIMEIDKESE